MEKICPKCQRAYGAADMFCPEDGTPLEAPRAVPAGAPAGASPGAHAAVPMAVAPGSAPHAIGATGESADDALLGRIVDGRYELTQLLGVGGMGRVYLAQHRFLKQPRAVKILHRGRVNDPSELVRFNRTAVHAGTIASDNVAGIFDFGETDDGLVYLAMEYVPGDTLTRMVKKEGPFELRRVADLTRQIAGGLDAAHTQGIIHRDLKPDNIMVMRDRQGREMVKIVDFGIAKAIGNESRGATEVGAVIGTLLYMSPEQLAGGTLDRKSDLYSLGLVVFYLLTGALPFGGTTPEEVIYGRFDPAGPRPLAAVRPSVTWPAALQAVFDRALARDASARYETAGAFASALTAAAEAPASTPKPAPPRRAPRPDVGARARGVAASLGGLATLFTETAKRRSREIAVAGLSLSVLALGAVAVRYWPDSPVSRRPSPDGGTETDSGIVLGPDGRDSLRDTTLRPDTPVVIDEPPPRQPLPGPSPRSKGNTSGTPRPKPETPTKVPATPTPDPEAQYRAAIQDLERYRVRLNPDSTVSAAAARSAIDRLNALMPTLRTRNDSLFAQLYQAHAHIHLNDVETACAVLRRIRSRASGTRLENVIEAYFGGYGKCS